MKCLATQPKQRYASAEELLADLRAYSAGEAIKARPDGIFGRLVRLARKYRRTAVFCTALAALLLVGSTLVTGLIAAKDRRALDAERMARDAERKALNAEAARVAAVAEATARAQRRMRAFTPYAEATDLLARGQLYDRAAKLLEEATQIDTEFPEAQFALGEAYRLAGLPDRAAAAYLGANDLSQKITGRPHLQALLAAGMTYDGAGDYKAGEQAFLQAERQGAGHPLALVGKAFRLGQAQRLKEARTVAEEALRQAPHLWETHFACGWVMEEQANQGLLPAEPTRMQAIAFIRKALELSPHQAEAWTWLASALAHTDVLANRAEALRIFDHAVGLEPHNGNRYVVRCVIRSGIGDANGAATDLQKARDLGAARPLLLNAQSYIAAKRGDLETVFRLTGQLIQEKQAWPSHVGNWAAAGFYLRRDQEVRGRYEEWCQAHADYPEVYALRAQLKARDGAVAAAVAEDRAGLKIAPYNYKLRAQLATHLEMLGSWHEGLAAAEAVLELSAGNFPAQLIRARCLAELGRGADAKAVLDSLQKSFPARSGEIEDLRRRLANRLPK